MIAGTGKSFEIKRVREHCVTVEDMPIKNDPCDYFTNLAEKKQVDQNNSDVFCLDADYSTTRLVTRQIPVIDNKPGDTFTSTLFLSEGEGIKGEGGLRTKGIFKKNFPDKPLITVVTVVFNGEKHLEDTILSVINQTYENVEYIVIDGGSTDGTLDIIKKYADRIDSWVSELDRGIYDAMNKGICLTQGNYVNFMNAGDCFYDKKTIAFANKNIKEKYSVFYGKTMLIDKWNNCNILYLPHEISIKNNYFEMPVCHQSLFYHLNCFKYHGLYDIQYRVCADYEHFLRLVSSNALFFKVNCIIAKVILGGFSFQNIQTNIRENYSIINKYYPQKKVQGFLHHKWLLIKFAIINFMICYNLLNYYRKIKYLLVSLKEKIV